MRDAGGEHRENERVMLLNTELQEENTERMSE